MTLIFISLGMRHINLACIVFYDADGKILLMHRNTDKYNHWEIPGGKIEANETAKDAAIREVMEELKMTATDIKLLAETEFKEPQKHVISTIFSARSNDKPIISEDSFDDCRYFSLDELAKRTDLSLNTQELLKQISTLPTLPN